MSASKPPAHALWLDPFGDFSQTVESALPLGLPSMCAASTAGNRRTERSGTTTAPAHNETFTDLVNPGADGMAGSRLLVFLNFYIFHFKNYFYPFYCMEYANWWFRKAFVLMKILILLTMTFLFVESLRKSNKSF